jgi:hypothetical protein
LCLEIFAEGKAPTAPAAPNPDIQKMLECIQFIAQLNQILRNLSTPTSEILVHVLRLRNLCDKILSRV